jgi:hypothetical protein
MRSNTSSHRSKAIHSRWAVPILAVAILGLPACDSYVKKSEYEATRAEADALRGQLQDTEKELEKSKQSHSHKYEMFRQNGQTWRFDAVTGSYCTMLARPEDWKNAALKEHSCECEDASNLQPPPSAEYLNSVCGE